MGTARGLSYRWGRKGAGIWGGSRSESGEKNATGAPCGQKHLAPGRQQGDGSAPGSVSSVPCVVFWLPGLFRQPVMQARQLGSVPSGPRAAGKQSWVPQPLPPTSRQTLRPHSQLPRAFLPPWRGQAGAEHGRLRELSPSLCHRPNPGRPYLRGTFSSSREQTGLEEGPGREVSMGSPCSSLFSPAKAENVH